MRRLGAALGDAPGGPLAPPSHVRLIPSICRDPLHSVQFISAQATIARTMTQQLGGRSTRSPSSRYSHGPPPAGQAGQERSFGPSAGTGPDPVRGRIRIRCRRSSPRDGNRCRGAVIRKLSGSWISCTNRGSPCTERGPSCAACLLIAAAERGGGDRGSSGRLHCCSCRLVHAVTRDHASDQCCFS
jgi:hypothetical protein